MNLKLCILRNESKTSQAEWENSCRKYNIDYDVVDFSRNSWLDGVLRKNYDCYLTRPPGAISYFKTLYDERLYIVSRVLNKKIYPGYEEILVYENKKILSYWLKGLGIPHPKTWVFYHLDEAVEFAKKCRFPIVGKSSIGASGSGVHIFKSKAEITNYIHQIFSEKGVKRSYGPNFRKDKKMARLLNVLANPLSFHRKVKSRRMASNIDPQRWFVILQEFIDTEFEWRVVKIGDSYFAHKKLPVKGMCSGTTKVRWEDPEPGILDFVADVCSRRDFHSQAVDIFEDRSGNYLVNEMQVFFGSENSHQMIVNGKPGRYIRQGNQWLFEEGDFNSNNSYDLRLRHLLALLKNNLL